MRKVKVLQGTGVFTGSHSLRVSHDGSDQDVSFKHVVIAVGSEPVQAAFLT